MWHSTKRNETWTKYVNGETRKRDRDPVAGTPSDAFSSNVTRNWQYYYQPLVSTRVFASIACWNCCVCINQVLVHFSLLRRLISSTNLANSYQRDNFPFKDVDSALAFLWFSFIACKLHNYKFKLSKQLRCKKETKNSQRNKYVRKDKLNDDGRRNIKIDKINDIFFSVLIMLNGCYICWTTKTAISLRDQWWSTK